jgi:hypothetical protein
MDKAIIIAAAVILLAAFALVVIYAMKIGSD